MSRKATKSAKVIHGRIIKRKARDGGNTAVMGLGIKTMVGNVEIMVFVLNNSSALNLTLGHIIPGRP